MRTRSRDGLGIVLMLVIVALLLSLVLLVSRMAMFQGEVRSTGRDRGREQALEVARSALAEARARLMLDAAQTGTDAFRAFRTAGQPEFRVQTPLAAQLGGGNVAAPVTVARVVARRALDLTEYEVAGLVRLETRVTYGPDPARTLRVSMDHEFKVVNLAPPRPFGKMAFSMATPEVLLGTDPNEQIVLSARALGNLAQVAREAAKQIGARRELAPALAGEVDALAARLEKLAPAGEGELPPGGPAWFGSSAKDLAKDMQLYVPPEKAAQGLDLTRLHLPSRIAPLLAGLGGVEAKFDQASAALHDALKATNLLSLLEVSKLEQPARAFAAAADALAQAHRALLDEVGKYQQEVLVLAGDPARQWLERYWTRLAGECWERRAFYEVDAGVGLDQLPSVDGVFRFAAPLSLSGAVEGRRVLIAEGHAKIDGLQRAAGAAGTGLLTVIVHGDVELSGDVDASVLVLPPAGARRATVRIAEGTRVHGVVALGPGVELPDPTGRVERDPLVDSGGFGTPLLEDRYRVALSPEPLAQGVLDS